MTLNPTMLHGLATVALLGSPACDGGAKADDKATAKKADAKKADAKKADAKKADAKKADAKKADAKKADAKRDDAKPDDTKTAGDGKADEGNADATGTVTPTPAVAAAPVDPKTLLDDEGHYSYGKDAFGELTSSLTDKEIVKLLGEPKSKGGRQMEEATGDIVEAWEYEAQGLSLWMSSDSMKGPQGVSAITVTKPSTLKTKLGVGIGSSRAEVVAAYGKFEDREMPSSPESFIAGSIYGGLMFDFTDGVVSRMFMGAGAE